MREAMLELLAAYEEIILQNGGGDPRGQSVAVPVYVPASLRSRLHLTSQLKHMLQGNVPTHSILQQVESKTI